VAKDTSDAKAEGAKSPPPPTPAADPVASAPPSSGPIVSATALEVPAAAQKFLVTPFEGEPAEVTAIDETDAISTWCQATSTPHEKRRLTVKRK
jgi:hypothetical protein